MRDVCRLTFLAAAVLLCAAPARGDVLILTNGARERGILLREEADGYWFQIGPGMKVFYATAEVERLERESADANAALRARWDEARAGARLSRVAQARPAGSQTTGDARAANDTWFERGGAAAAEDAEPLKVVPKEERYDFISGGGLEPGTSTEADVRAVLGAPDETLETEDGRTIWQYDVESGDVYALQFGEVEDRIVLTGMWFVSNVEAKARRQRKAAGFRQIHGG